MTHLAHKAEHGVDMTTGPIVAVRIECADLGDTTTLSETVAEADEQIERALIGSGAWQGEGLQEVVAEKGYHSTELLVGLEEVGLRCYISEPDRGRRKWREDFEGQQAVYANRRRIRSLRGRRMQRLRGERTERPFAHLYETGAMRRTHLPGHRNILKRLLIHNGAFNLGLLLRQWLGKGTPRGLQGRARAFLALISRLLRPLKPVPTLQRALRSYQPSLPHSSSPGSGGPYVH